MLFSSFFLIVRVICGSINIVVVHVHYQCLKAGLLCCRGFIPDLRKDTFRVLCPCRQWFMKFPHHYNKHGKSRYWLYCVESTINQQLKLKKIFSLNSCYWLCVQLWHNDEQTTALCTTSTDREVSQRMVLSSSGWSSFKLHQLVKVPCSADVFPIINTTTLNNKQSSL